MNRVLQRFGSRLTVDDSTRNVPTGIASPVYSERRRKNPSGALLAELLHPRAGH
jgi:hypothetical protein